ncbi:MAG: tRNA lysidine(34) synthetase TilS [Betaproteobacteria bacterium]|nr:tRNA lysidine(34) synthetase TilS [Betaproteobacteria bacterium]
MANSRKASAARGLDRNAGDDPVARVDRTVAEWLEAHAEYGHHQGDPALLIVAFSGGLDSSILLDALARQIEHQFKGQFKDQLEDPSEGLSDCRFQGSAKRWQLRALHVHHGLQPAADAWPAHCEAFAQARGIACETLRVRVGSRQRQDGLEAAARAVRYEAIGQRAQALNARAVLTAHHADDQLETLLMRLARGTGLDGLTGIADDRPWPAGGPHCRLWRPFLGLDRSTLERAARARGLVWIEDPSNADAAITRNAVRRDVLPALDAALPDWRQGFLRARALLEEANERLAEQTRLDRSACEVGCHADHCLNATVLASLPGSRRRAVWRSWLAGLGLRMPSVRRLDAIDRSLALSPSGESVHEGWRLRRWRDVIRATELTGRVGQGSETEDPSVSGELPAPGDVTVVWRGEPALWIEPWRGWLLFDQAGLKPGLDPQWLAAHALRLSAQRAGARMRIAPLARTRTLKGLYQSAAVPPWQRRCLPLVFAGDRLLFAAGLGMNCRLIEEAPGPLVLGWRALENGV